VIIEPVYLILIFIKEVNNIASRESHADPVNRDYYLYGIVFLLIIIRKGSRVEAGAFGRNLKILINVKSFTTVR